MVAAFPSFGMRSQVSLAGGAQPQWRADRKELFFHALDQRMMAVDVTGGDTLRTGPVRELFRTNPAVLSNQVYNYAATPDGQRFFLREPVEGGNTGVFVEPLYVVTNWTALVQDDPRLTRPRATARSASRVNRGSVRTDTASPPASVNAWRAWVTRSRRGRGPREVRRSQAARQQPYRDSTRNPVDPSGRPWSRDRTGCAGR